MWNPEQLHHDRILRLRHVRHQQTWICEQFTYGVVREGVIAENFLRISANFPQNFCTLSWHNKKTFSAKFTQNFPQTFHKNPFANAPISELLNLWGSAVNQRGWENKGPPDVAQKSFSQKRVKMVLCPFHRRVIGKSALESASFWDEISGWFLGAPFSPGPFVLLLRGTERFRAFLTPGQPACESDNKSLCVLLRTRENKHFLLANQLVVLGLTTFFAKCWCVKSLCAFLAWDHFCNFQEPLSALILNVLFSRDFARGTTPIKAFGEAAH